MVFVSTITLSSKPVHFHIPRGFRVYAIKNSDWPARSVWGFAFLLTDLAAQVRVVRAQPTVFSHPPSFVGVRAVS